MQISETQKIKEIYSFTIEVDALRNLTFCVIDIILDLPPTTSPMDRKDALTRRPLDFDQEEETRKMETSKWLENHFGSESRSSRDSLVEEEEPQQQPPKTSYFNVTIKSQPPRIQEQPLAQQSSYPVSHNRSPSRQEPERDRSYFQGLIFLKLIRFLIKT